MKKNFVLIALALVVTTSFALPIFATDKEITPETNIDVEKLENNYSENNLVEVLQELSEKCQNIVETEYYEQTIQEAIDEINEKYDVGLRIEPINEESRDLNSCISKEYKAFLEEFASTMAGFRETSVKQFEERTGDVK